MSAGTRKQKKSQDKVPLAPWEVRANDGGDDEASQLLSLSSDDGKSEGHGAETKKKKGERVEP